MKVNGKKTSKYPVKLKEGKRYEIGPIRGNPRQFKIRNPKKDGKASIEFKKSWRKLKVKKIKNIQEGLKTTGKRTLKKNDDILNKRLELCGYKVIIEKK